MPHIEGNKLVDDEGIVTHLQVNNKWYSIEKYFEGNGYETYRKANEKVRDAFLIIARIDFSQLELAWARLERAEKECREGGISQ